MKKGTLVFLLGAFCVLVLYSTFAQANTTGTSSATPPGAPATGTPSIQSNASHRLIRINQLDPGQYSSQEEYSLWAASTCSTASMAEVMNAYGKSFRITDVLQGERSVHAISPEEGLLDEEGIARTVERFSFRAVLSHQVPLDQVIALANAGTPIIVSFPPDRYPPGGHLLVVVGGNARTVFIADSSSYHYTSLSSAQFLRWWGGFTAVVTPARGG